MLDIYEYLLDIDVVKHPSVNYNDRLHVEHLISLYEDHHWTIYKKKLCGFSIGSS